MTSFEQQYLGMLRTLLATGVTVSNERTKTSTVAMFDYKLTVNEGEFPFSTVRPASPRLAFEELWMFLRGDTDTKYLESKGVNFWKGNTSREFLDSRDMQYLPEGDLGRAYSKQFRDFGGHDTYQGDGGVDQLEMLYVELSKDRYSRRLVTTLWNPKESDEMVLSPCWHTHQFVVLPDENGCDTLHLKLINRSLDALFGCVFAVQQYRLYQIALAKLFGFKVGKLVCDLSQVHLYENQLQYTAELLKRPYNFDKCYDIERVKINKDLVIMDDLIELTWKDFDISMPTVNVSKFKNERPEMVA